MDQQAWWSRTIRRWMALASGGPCNRPGRCYVDPDSDYRAPRCPEGYRYNRASIGCCEETKKRKSDRAYVVPPKFQVDEEELRGRWDTDVSGVPRTDLPPPVAAAAPSAAVDMEEEVVEFGRFRRAYLQHKPNTSEHKVRAKYTKALRVSRMLH